MNKTRALEIAAELAASLDEVTQDDVNEYARVNAEVLRLEKRRSELGDKIKKFLVAGGQCPANGPYLVYNQAQNRCIYDWKHIYEAVYEALGRNTRRLVSALVEAMLKERRDVPTLVVGVNPDWKEDNRS
jgi:hypothetical protein